MLLHISKRLYTELLYPLQLTVEKGISNFPTQNYEIPSSIFIVCIAFDMSKRVNVGLRYEVYARLKERGKFGETFSDVVSRIMNESILSSIKKEDGGKNLNDNKSKVN
jgi:hypothetical protein